MTIEMMYDPEDGSSSYSITKDSFDLAIEWLEGLKRKAGEVAKESKIENEDE